MALGPWRIGSTTVGGWSQARPWRLESNRDHGERSIATLAQLRALGVDITAEVVNGPGGRQVLVHDPSGNPMELFEAATAT